MMFCSQMVLEWGGLPNDAYELIKDMVTLKNEEIVTFNLQGERVGSEKN